MDDPILEAAYKLGREKGERMGELFIDHKTKLNQAETLLEGFKEDDSDVLDLCPEPISGEWGDDPTPMRIIECIVDLVKVNAKHVSIKDALESIESVLDTYEQAYRDGFWETSLKRASEIVEAHKDA